MKKVFLHFRDQGTSNWENRYVEFERLPVTNEYITLDTGGDWYKVEIVVHTPHFTNEDLKNFEEENIIYAEIFAVKTDHITELNKNLSK